MADSMATLYRDHRTRRYVKQLVCASLACAFIEAAPLLTSGAYDYGQEEETAAVSVESGQTVQYVPYRSSYSSPGISEQELDQAIVWYARQHHLSQALLRAVIKTESNFRPTAVSRTGALGLMQLMPRTAASLKVHDPFNPVENIRGGATHLRYLLDRFHGNLPLALAAYNAGEYRVKRYQQSPPIQETRFYVKKVLSYYHTFRSVKNRHASTPSQFERSPSFSRSTALARIIHECRHEAAETEARRGFSQVRATQAYLRSVEETEREKLRRARGSAAVVGAHE